MKLASYPAIGQRVAYVRQNPSTGEILTGFGLVLAIHLDAVKRVMAHLSEKNAEGHEEKFNVDLTCLEPTEEFIIRFTEVTNKVKEISSEGNKQVISVVSDFNKKVEDVYSGILGEPIEIEA